MSVILKFGSFITSAQTVKKTPSLVTLLLAYCANSQRFTETTQQSKLPCHQVFRFDYDFWAFEPIKKAQPHPRAICSESLCSDLMELLIAKHAQRSKKKI